MNLFDRWLKRLEGPKVSLFWASASLLGLLYVYGFFPGEYGNPKPRECVFLVEYGSDLKLDKDVLARFHEEMAKAYPITRVVVRQNKDIQGIELSVPSPETLNRTENQPD